MSKKRMWLLALACVCVAVPVVADGPEMALPDEVSYLADEIVSLVVDSVPHSQKNPALVAVRSVERNGSIPPFGELLAMTISTRIAIAGDPGLSVRAHYPVDSYLSDFSTNGSEMPAEGDFLVRPDYVLIGESFETEGMLHVLFQLIEVETETILTGLEDALVLDQWLYELLNTSEYTDEGMYVEPDRFEPDSIDNPLEVSVDEYVGERTIGPPGDEDWYLITVEGVEGKSILEVTTTGETDSYIEVYGPGDPGTLIAENDDALDANAAVSVLVENGQQIWVLVRGYDESVGGNYGFRTSISSFEGDPNEPDNSLQDANQLMVGYDPVGSYIMPSADEDWYFVDIAEVPGPNTILSVETFGELDTFLDLLDSNGVEMLSNDDGGEGDNARIDFFIEGPGRFYVKVRHYDGTDQGEYRIYAEFVQATPDQWEPDDSRGEARQVEIDGTPQVKNFTPADDQDWITFTLAETSTVEIRTAGDVDTFIKLFDRLGNLIAEDDDSGGDYNALIERLLQRGQYYLRIHQVEGDAVFGAEYALEITAN